MDDHKLDGYGTPWNGCRIDGEELILPNGEHYTAHELQFIRWDRDTWRRLAQALQRDLDRSGNANAVVFSLDELVSLRKAMRLLDDKLPGYKIQAVGGAQALRPASVRR